MFGTTSSIQNVKIELIYPTSVIFPRNGSHVFILMYEDKNEIVNIRKGI